MPPPVIRRLPVRGEFGSLGRHKARFTHDNLQSTTFISLQNNNTKNKGEKPVGITDELSKEPDPAKTSPSEPQQHSLRIAVKDNIATAGFPTTCGSRILKDYQSPFEAPVAMAARTHGNTIIGKTNMDEFGMGSHSTHSFFGPVRNRTPYIHYSAGGSSGGSAMAVTKGTCQVALGTDTGGSIRLPAAYTRVVGFKPSYGYLSRRGVVPYANSLDTVGILSRDVTSALVMFVRLNKRDDLDPSNLSKASRQWIQHLLYKAAAEREAKNTSAFSDLKIGVPIEYNIAELEPAVRRAWENALALFQKQGCTVVPVSLPNTKHALSAYYVLAPAEAASNLSKYDGVRYGTRSHLSDGAGDVLYSQTRGEGFGEEVKRRILLGSYTLSSKAIDNYFIKAQKVRRLVQHDFDRVFSLPNPLRPPQQFDLSDMDESVRLKNKLGPSEVDFIVCPTAPTVPPALRYVSKQSPVDAYMNDVFTVPASLAGLPAISVPHEGFIPSEAFKSAKNPKSIGIQIIGQYSDDERLLRTAQTFLELQQEKTQPRPREDTESRWMRALKTSGLSETQALQVLKLVESGLFDQRPAKEASDPGLANLSSVKETAPQEPKRPDQSRLRRHSFPGKPKSSSKKEDIVKETAPQEPKRPDQSRLKTDSSPEESKSSSKKDDILEQFDMDQRFVDALSTWEDMERKP